MRTPPVLDEPSILGRFAAAALALITATAADAQGPRGRGGRDISVMTRNLYVGAPLENLLLAGDLGTLLVQVDAIWQAVQRTDFRERSEALADEIVAAAPDLVGLQEAALWRIQSPGDILVGGSTPATDVAFDFVRILLEDLAERGARYEVVAALVETDAELPSIRRDDIRFTDRDVILARRDRPPGFLRILGTDSGHFENLLSLPVGGPFGPMVTITRGWVSADVKVRGKVFRFVNTHLEDVPFVLIQEAQARELLAGPAAVRTPVVLAGDFNSDAFGIGTNSYEILLAAGFTDVWTAVAGADPGLTWGHAADLRNPVPALTRRLDLILFSGPFRPRSAFVVGEEVGDRTASGLWPSDHAGVVASLRIRGRFRR